MLAALRRDFRSAPVTFCLLAASVVLFIVVELSRPRINDPKGVRQVFGMVEQLHFSDDEDVSGPFDLWEGPWWRWLRIPISAFHHANFLHLFCNVSTVWFFGPMMERRMRRAAYLGFWFFSALVPFLPEYFLGHTPLGISGIACAMFGWCLIERQFDPVIAGRLNEQAIRTFWIFLFAMLIATAFDLLHIANVAHFAGVGYGWLNARASHSRTGRLTWMAAHALIPIAIYGLLHPEWNGRYQAFLGRRAVLHARDLSAGIPYFRKAVRREPGLARIWLHLAAEKELTAEPLEAWRLAIEGLQHNRSSKELTEFLRKLWLLLPAEDRESARKAVQDKFGNEAQAWADRLQMATPIAKQPDSPLSDLFPALPSDQPPTSSDSSERQGRPGRKRSPAAVDPEKMDSASEGRTL